LNFGAGTTPLIRAARTNDVAVMKLLLDGGADPFISLPDKTNALLIAAGQGYGGTRGDGPRLPAPTEETAIEAVQLLVGLPPCPARRGVANAERVRRAVASRVVRVQRPV
jgi:hypothetical protein